MYRHLIDLVHPFHRRGFYVLPHGVLVALVVGASYLSGFGSGWFARTQYDARYFQAHYSFPGLKQPVPGVSAPVQDIPRPGLAPAASIQIGRYPAVGDQGQLGACAAWASAWVASYEYRLLHNDWIRFSPRYEYDHYSATYAGGQDAGSWPDQDLETLSTTGIPLFKQLPEPPYVIDNPIPTTDPAGGSLVADAAKRITPFQIHVISGFAQGAGQGAVDGVRAAIAAGHPVLVALPVYPEYDNATAQPLIVSPTAGEYSRGGHENSIIAYDDTKVFPDGTIGGVEVQNQWTKAWAANGRAWLSYDFVRRYTFGLEYLTLGTAAPHAGPKPTFRANPKAHLTEPPFDPGAAPGVTAGATAWYVHGVHLYNRADGADLSGTINQLGDQYHVWPVAIAAVIGTESAFNPTAERWAGGLDNSCGLMQQIITNVYARIGYVGPRGACNWEEIPYNSIAFGSQILRENDLYHGGRVGWPFAYGMYNAGAGLPDSYYYNMTGQAYLNFVNNFLPWYRYSLAVFAGGTAPTPPPPPKPVRHAFPRKKWGPLSPYYNGKLDWAASIWLRHQSLGKALDRGRFYGRRHGFTRTRFQHGAILTWPSYHAARIKEHR